MAVLLHYMIKIMNDCQVKHLTLNIEGHYFYIRLGYIDLAGLNFDQHNKPNYQQHLLFLKSFIR